MKKYLILAALLTAVSPLSLFANDWGVFENYENNVGNYGVYKIINNTKYWGSKVKLLFLLLNLPCIT